MLNYYQRFVPKLASVLTPLHSAVAAAGKSKSITWDPACDAAFTASKEALAQATLLHHPSPFSETALTVDASDVAIGAELAQRSRGSSEWKPIAFFSKTLTSTERKYSAFDWELLAIFSSIKHFRHFLEGRSFTVFTDHKPLTFALPSTTDRSPRQTRHLSYIAEFTNDIRHVKGDVYIVADALSSPELSTCQLPVVDWKAMADAQDAPEAAGTSLLLSRVAFHGTRLLCDTSTGTLRPLVPLAFQRGIFDAIHSLSHPGSRPSIRMVSSRFIWPGLRRDVRSWCRTCSHSSSTDASYGPQSAPYLSLIHI